MSEEPERELEERAKEVDREIEKAEQGWDAAQQEAPSTLDDEEPLDEENPVGGV